MRRHRGRRRHKATTQANHVADPHPLAMHSACPNNVQVSSQTQAFLNNMGLAWDLLVWGTPSPPPFLRVGVPGLSAAVLVCWPPLPEPLLYPPPSPLLPPPPPPAPSPRAVPRPFVTWVPPPPPFPPPPLPVDFYGQPPPAPPGAPPPGVPRAPPPPPPGWEGHWSPALERRFGGGGA